MHLYQGSTHQFIADVTQARLANQLSDRFFDEFRYRPAPSEVTSWRNSLGAMASVLQLADLTDQGILVELKLPLTSQRLDVLITGSNPATGDSAVIVELKQWTEVGRSNITDCVTVDFGGRGADGARPRVTWLEGERGRLRARIDWLCEGPERARESSNRPTASPLVSQPVTERRVKSSDPLCPM